MQGQDSPHRVRDTGGNIIKGCAPGVRIVFVLKNRRFYDLVLRDERTGQQVMFVQRGIGEVVRFLNGWDLTVDADSLRRQLDDLAAGRS